MHLNTTTIAALGFVLSAAAVPASPSWIVDPAAATDAPAVPDSGHPVAADTNVAAGTTGDANVRNYCDFPVYLYACGQDPSTCTPEYTLAAHTGTYSEQFSTPNNGRSIKMGLTAGEVQKPILQFEYTNTGSGQVAYDLSEVNGNPFGPYGFFLTSNNGNCFHENCPAPGTHNVCPWVFTTPTNGMVSDCPISSSIGVTLCG
ncbi:hypothetical protein BDR22DRAFT_885620 [Usnea florida]